MRGADYIDSYGRHNRHQLLLTMLFSLEIHVALPTHKALDQGSNSKVPSKRDHSP